ncbi:MAG: TetR/AcrR family transcriptional regulator [Bacteroidetes bacterium]|nr:MAG: TetR/AcrR family transcriptional regulator [Bacteroidota bacterium]
MISQSEKGDKKAEILASALKLFVESGFHGTPTSKIAKEAGVANGTLFHYYKTKDDLIIGLYIDIKSKLGACIRPQGLPGEDTKATCKRNYVDALYWAMNNEAEFRFVQQFSSSPYLMLITPDEMKKQSKAWLSMIEEGIVKGEVEPLPLEYINTLISSNIYGLHQYLSMAKLSNDAQAKVIEDSFERLWRMIGA